jgi:hypothetical protein
MILDIVSLAAGLFILASVVVSVIRPAHRWSLAARLRARYFDEPATWSGWRYDVVVPALLGLLFMVSALRGLLG